MNLASALASAAGAARRIGVAALVALVPTLAPAVGGGALARPAVAAPVVTPSVSPAPCPTPAGSPPQRLTVAITAIDPPAPQPHTEVTVSALLRNGGSTAVDHLLVRLRLAYRPESSRSQLQADAGSDGEFNSDVPVGAEWVGQDPLTAGTCTSVQLHIDTDNVGFGGFGDRSLPGVYRLGVEVDQIVGTAGLQPLARTDTFLAWMPAGGYQPLQLAWLWPVVDRPRVAADGALTDDGLTGEVSPGGRLAVLLSDAEAAAHQSGTVQLPTPPAAGTPAKHRPAAAVTLPRRPVPVTYAVDPALLSTLQTMSRGPYRVHTDDGKITQRSSGTAAAKTFLETLHDQVGSETLLALPYADPDVSALTRAGASGVLRAAENARDAVLASADLPEASTAVAWPPNGSLSQQALDDVTAPAIVVDSAELPSTAAATPTAVTTLSRTGGPVTVLAADHVLSRLAAQPVDGSGVRLRQEFLATTAMIVAEAPSRQRVAVIAPPHLFDPRGTLAGELLSLSGTLPWLRPIPIGTAAESAPDDAGRPPTLHYSASARAAELPTELMADVSSATDRAHDLRTMLCAPTAGAAGAGSSCSPDPIVLPIERALLAAASATWRADPDGARQLYNEAVSATRAILGRVHITSTGTVTLLSRSGSIPITIANDLTVPVSVRLHVTTPNPAQLSVTSDRVYVIGAGDKFTQTMQARTPSAGRAKFPIYLQLETPGGDPIGPASQLIVRSSSYGGVAVAITVGAFVVLFGAAGIRLLRSALRLRRGGPPGPADGPPPPPPGDLPGGLGSPPPAESTRT